MKHHALLLRQFCLSVQNINWEIWEWMSFSLLEYIFHFEGNIKFPPLFWLGNDGLTANQAHELNTANN